MKTRMFISLLIATLLVLAGWEAQARGFVKKVNCTKGQTIARALQGLDFIPITVQSSGGHGVVIEGGSATVINSAISSNTLVGINVSLAGNARIGITDRNQYAGNTISNNQGSGLLISNSASAHIGGNTISGNGTNPNSLFGIFGVLISSASANLVGNNSITGNSGSGVLVERSSVRIGNPNFGLPITNVITGNGATLLPNAATGGIFANQGSSLQIQGATINGNTGNGVNLQLHSTARMYDDTVNNNTGNGILLGQGAGLLLQDPAVIVTGNAQFGLQCFGNEASFTGNFSGILGNTGGDVSSSCTGF